MNINILSDKCLMETLTKLNYSLQQLLSLRLVCCRWCSMIEIFTSIHYKSIQIFGSHQDLETFSKELSKLKHVKLPRFVSAKLIINMQTLRNVKFCDFLCRLFCNLKSVLIYLRPEVPFYKLPYLVGKLGTTLRVISLFGSINPFIQHGHFSLQLFSVMEKQLLHIEHLNLFVRHLHRFSDFRDGYPDIRMYRVMNQLKSLSLAHFGGNLISILTSLGPNCRQIYFGEGVHQSDLPQVIHKLKFFPHQVCFRTLNRLIIPPVDAELIMEIKKNFTQLEIIIN